MTAKTQWYNGPLKERISFFATVAQMLGVAVLIFIPFQLKQTIKTNKVAIRGQLYSTNDEINQQHLDDSREVLSTLWVIVPVTVPTHKYAFSYLQLVTSDTVALHSRNASELYMRMFGSVTYADSSTKESTAKLRSLFYFVQNNFYALHNAFDYSKDGIITENEWRTWKGVLREMHAHPVLVTSIWQGYQYRYFSRDFARFLKSELCDDNPPKDVTDIAQWRRGREFIRLYYPDMFRKDWQESLPDY